MRCSKVKEILGAYLDGELLERRAKKVRRHLAECSACAWELKSFQKIDELGRWMAEAESPQLPRGQWESYLAGLHGKLEREEIYQQSNMANFFNRRWVLPLAFAANWAKKMAPGLAAAVVIAALIIGVSYIRYKPLRIAAPEDSEPEKIAINLYLKEHENAIMHASYSPRPPQAGIELGYEDILYYNAARRLDGEWPGETGVFLRAPRRSSYPARGEPSQASDISNGHSLSLQKAQEAVSFRIAAPQIIHPGYFLETIRKIEGRECLQLIYTNGISTLSLFEQAAGSEEKFHSGDFREYVMYSKGGDEPVSIIGWNSAEVSFTLIGEESLSELIGIIRAIQGSYLGDE